VPAFRRSIDSGVTSAIPRNSGTQESSLNRANSLWRDKAVRICKMYYLRRSVAFFILVLWLGLRNYNKMKSRIVTARNKRPRISEAGR